jgi:hypothetical protein
MNAESVAIGLLIDLIVIEISTMATIRIIADTAVTVAIWVYIGAYIIADGTVAYTIQPVMPISLAV